MPGGVDRPAHRAAQGVDLADDLPLGDAADGRVAAHLADGVAVGGQQRRLGPHPRSRQRRLGAGVAGADDQHVVFVDRISHFWIKQPFLDQVGSERSGARQGHCWPRPLNIPSTAYTLSSPIGT